MEEKLWENYFKDRSKKNELELLKFHEKLVYYIENRLNLTVPKHIEREDLIQAGMLGLLKSIRDFDKYRRCKFVSYAYVKIKGSLIDEARRQCGVRRSSLRKGVESEDFISDKKISEPLNIKDHALPVYQDDSFIDKEYLDYVVLKITKRDAELLKIVKEYYFNGKHMSEIAKMFRRSEPWVSIKIKEFKNLIKREYGVAC